MTSFQPLFVTGTARSGSTLLYHMLNAHPAILMASDPYLPLFREYRNAVLRQCDPELHRYMTLPFQDYYFTSERIEMMRAIQGSSLDLPFQHNENPMLLDSLQGRVMSESPYLLPYLSELLAPTYHAAFERSLTIIAQARHATTQQWIGFKDVWIIEFFAALARSFPEARFIVILRDPRATVASMLNQKDVTQRAHTLSYARHWRKYTAFVEHYQQSPLLKDRLHVVRYEDLVSEPDAHAWRLCEFLGVDYDPHMIDPRNYTNAATGEIWQGNSTFTDNLGGIATSMKERWREKLLPAVIKLVDWLCEPEMQLAGYETVYSNAEAMPDAEVLSYLLKNDQEPCSWRSDLQDLQQDCGFELFRRKLLTAESISFDFDLVCRSFLFEEVFTRLRQLAAQQDNSQETG